jgi:hypothetical protein
MRSAEFLTSAEPTFTVGRIHSRRPRRFDRQGHRRASQFPGLPIVDPFPGSGNTLYWLRRVPNARARGFGLDPGVFEFTQQDLCRSPHIPQAGATTTTRGERNWVTITMALSSSAVSPVVTARKSSVPPRIATRTSPIFFPGPICAVTRPNLPTGPPLSFIIVSFSRR